MAGAAATLLKHPAVRQIPNTVAQMMLENFNQKRLSTPQKMDYVILTLPSVLPAFPEQVNPIQARLFGAPPMSQVEFDLTLRRIELDPRIKGVVLRLSGFAMSMADLQNVRDSILRFRESGKQVATLSYAYDTASYFVASAADQVLLQSGGTLYTTGLSRSVTFMKDGLAAVGLEVERVAVSPYKTAMDTFAEQDMSPELRQQMDWLLDSAFEQVVNAIADGRSMNVDDVQLMIDQAPHTDFEASEHGYVDGVVNAEGLSQFFEINAEMILDWEQAQNLVPIIWYPRPEKYVGVLHLAGTIVDGESAKPPRDVPMPFVGSQRIGSETVVQQIRHLMKQESLAALVVQIDSPGGSATASEAIASALDELAKTRPVVVFMNGVAASGGYYISTPAQWIVAQGGTITGSIGVISGKVTGGELLDKLRFNAVTLKRGANADIFDTNQGFTKSQREKIEAGILRTYEQFKARVATSRDMPLDDVEPLSGGRVWTGQQALEHGLIDEIGGLATALAKARELANLPEKSPAFMVSPDKKPLAPQLAAQVDPAAMLRYWQEGTQLILDGKAQMLMPMRWQGF